MTQFTDTLGESVLASELCKGSVMITASLKQATGVMRESPLHQPFNTLNPVTFSKRKPISIKNGSNSLISLVVVNVIPQIGSNSFLELGSC